MKTPTRQDLAAARIALAMHEIEAAQNLLFSAMAHLSTIVGGVPDWRRVGKLGDSVKAAWYKLDANRERLTRRGIDRDYDPVYDDKVLLRTADLSPRGQRKWSGVCVTCGLTRENHRDNPNACPEYVSEEADHA